MLEEEHRNPYLLRLGDSKEVVDLVEKRGKQAIVLYKGAHTMVPRRRLERIQKKHILPE